MTKEQADIIINCQTALIESLTDEQAEKWDEICMNVTGPEDIVDGLNALITFIEGE